MRANDFLTERQSDSNMELSRLYRVAKARYPMYDKEVALLKYLQSGSIRSDKEDVKIADLNYHPIDCSILPCGMFYPKGTIIMRRPSTVKEVLPSLILL